MKRTGSSHCRSMQYKKLMFIYYMRMRSSRFYFICFCMGLLILLVVLSPSLHRKWYWSLCWCCHLSPSSMGLLQFPPLYSSPECVCVFLYITSVVRSGIHTPFFHFFFMAMDLTNACLQYTMELGLCL